MANKLTSFLPISYFLTSFIFLLSISIYGQTTYTWIGANNASWATNTNWSPTRTTPATSDILQFNDGTTKNITSVPTETIGKLLVNTSTNITLQISTGTIALSIGDLSGDDLVIASGSSLTIGGTGTSLTVTLASSATANISGTLTINSGRTYNTNGTSVVTTVLGSIINSGTITNATSSKFFFSSGSTYQHSQDGGTIPTATWNANSTCLITGIIGTEPGGLIQTFSNFIWNCTGQTSNVDLTNNPTISGNLKVQSTGTRRIRWASGTVSITGNYEQTGGEVRMATSSPVTLEIGGNFSLTSGTLNLTSDVAVGTINISGNFTHTGGTLTESSSSATGSIIFKGSGVQTFISGGTSTISNTINFTINNPAGITLLTSVAFPAGLTMTNGNIALNGNTLTLGTSTANTGTLSWTNGFMVGSGSFTRWYSTASITIGNVLGLFPMGNGTDNRSVWIGGTPSTGGTVSVQHTNAAGTTTLSFVENLQTFDKRTNMSWTLSNANGFAGSALSLRIQGSGIPGINAVGDLNISLASTAAGGTYSSPGGTTTDPQVNRTGLTQATLANTFYFAATSASPLPVELSYFSAKVSENGVCLNWRTETEVSNYGFEILRQAQDDNWQVLGFVEGHGNSNSPHNYSFIDQNVSGGKYAYRLKQIDRDGNFEYSKSVEVNFGSPGNFELNQNYPNPFNPTTTISFSLPESGNVKLIVYNIIGEQVAKLVNGFREAGVHTINFNAENFNSGLYLYKLETAGFTDVKKMVLVK